MFKKFVATCMVGAQLCLVASLPAHASDRAVNPELSLLETVITLKGLGLSDSELSLQINAALAHYDRTAQATGREERLSSALVGLQVFTPQQARKFAAEAKAAQARLATQHASSESEQVAAVRAQVEALSRVSLNGAQFSSCTLGWGLSIGGAITAVVGLTLMYDNPTCYEDYTRPYGCYREHCHGTGEYRDCYDRYETCYHTTCTQPGYYPHREAGTITLIAGGVATAAGILLLVLDGDC
jgi:hypothetical protein